jgi:hypothetical protein
MKFIIFGVIIVAICSYGNVYASNARADHGHHAVAHAAPSTASDPQSGNGGRASLVDDYQPWPEAEMRRFQKPKFVPYAGE